MYNYLFICQDLYGILNSIRKFLNDYSLYAGIYIF